VRQIVVGVVLGLILIGSAIAEEDYQAFRRVVISHWRPLASGPKLTGEVEIDRNGSINYVRFVNEDPASAPLRQSLVTAIYQSAPLTMYLPNIGIDGTVRAGFEFDPAPLYRRFVNPAPASIPPSTLPAKQANRSPNAKPSFDCSTAKTASARLICADSELARMDGQLAVPYRQRLGQLVGTDRNAFVEEQRRWIVGRNTRCGLMGRDTEPTEALMSAKPCMVDAIAKRTADLNGSAAGQPLAPAVPNAAASAQVRGPAATPATPGTPPQGAPPSATNQVQFTIPAGLTSEQVIAQLLQLKFLTGEIRTAPSEGSLLPGTYKVSAGSSREQVITVMQQAQQNAVKEIWDKRSPNLPISTANALVVLASIVEKETTKSDQRLELQRFLSTD
jgi:uncharacterized protein YecT (DUF1311 family)